MNILLATNNQGKVERFRNLITHTGLDITIQTPKDLGIDVIDVEENAKTLADNAELKARAYFGKVDMPILANDTGFYVEGEGLVDAPKRAALQGANENELTTEQISEKLSTFWKGIATKYGGEVDAAWVEAFVVLYPDGTLRKSDSRREIVLTNREFGKPHIQMPVRALYYSKVTGKPSLQHSPEEELIELRPIIDALREVLK